jgi:hypothetical protein
MRTKTLLLAAALSAAGIVASVAQSNVYSVNVVGYVNVNLAAGFNMIANPLDLDGTGTNNTVNTVFSNSLPSGSTVYAFAGGSYTSAGYSTKGGWAPAAGVTAANAALQPGGGVFVNVPSATTVTVVGNVLQGALAQPFAAGFNIVSSKVPQAGLLATDLGYTPATGDIVYQFNSTAQTYNTANGYSTKGGWAPSQPTVGVGEAFFLSSGAGGTWSRNFTVQ